MAVRLFETSCRFDISKGRRTTFIFPVGRRATHTPIAEQRAHCVSAQGVGASSRWSGARPLKQEHPLLERHSAAAALPE
eukprot:scaffold76250_cov18-Prasinocladus_malaysianus.AAC.1